MNKQINDDMAISNESVSLDYLRMVNEVSMEEASVLSAGAWAEMDVTVECGPDV